MKRHWVTFLLLHCRVHHWPGPSHSGHKVHNKNLSCCFSHFGACCPAVLLSWTAAQDSTQQQGEGGGSTSTNVVVYHMCDKVKTAIHASRIRANAAKCGGTFAKCGGTSLRNFGMRRCTLFLIPVFERWSGGCGRGVSSMDVLDMDVRDLAVTCCPGGTGLLSCCPTGQQDSRTAGQQKSGN